MPLILGTNSIKVTGFDVANSLRFDDGSSDYLNKTFGSNGTRTTWTFSTWIKRANLGSDQRILSCDDDASGNQDDFIKFLSGDTFQIGFYNSGFYGEITTNRVFRDVSAFYHIVVVWDTTNGTAGDRIRLYVNGNRETSFSSSTNPSSGATSFINSTSYPLEIGRRGLNGTQYLNGYMAECVFIDGQALDPTSFGEFDSDTNIWKPIDVSDLTFGTNGFYLDFENSGSLGADVSGNGNNFTVNNLTSVDQSTDTCTNNFATLNPLNNVGSGNSLTYSEGNLKVVTAGGSSYFGGSGNIGVTTGKWYVEVEVEAQSSGLQGVIGFSANVAEEARQNRHAGQVGSTTFPSVIYNAYNGTYHKDNAGETSYGDTYTAGDIIGIALDLDNNYIYFSKNGTFQNSGDPTSGSSGTGGISLTATDNEFFLCLGDAGSSTTATYFINFGSPPFAISSGNADGNGYGNFEYAVPSGYYSLNTKNLAEYG